MFDQAEFSLSRFSLPEKDLAYIAGLFDGEGSVSVNRSSTRYKAHRYALMVAIAMLEQEPLLLCARVFGGHVGVKKQRTGYASLWTWALASQKALHFLKTIRPYLLGKGQQVDIAITFQEAYWEPQHLHFRGKSLSPVNWTQPRRPGHNSPTYAVPEASGAKPLGLEYSNSPNSLASPYLSHSFLLLTFGFPLPGGIYQIASLKASFDGWGWIWNDGITA